MRWSGLLMLIGFILAGYCVLFAPSGELGSHTINLQMLFERGLGMLAGVGLVLLGGLYRVCEVIQDTVPEPQIIVRKPEEADWSGVSARTN